MIKELNPKAAYALLTQRSEAVLIDVRSTVEYEYVGHPLNAVHVPLKEPPLWEEDESFVAKVEHALVERQSGGTPVREIPVLLMCRSGKRSEAGSRLLTEAGFKEVYNILEGFEGDKDDGGHRNSVNGWRFHNLPWEQS